FRIVSTESDPGRGSTTAAGGVEASTSQACRPSGSQNHQIPRDDNFSLELLGGQVAPPLLSNSVDARCQMRENEGLDCRLPCKTADLFDRRMIDLHVRHVIVEADWNALGDAVAHVGFERGHIHRLVHKHINASANRATASVGAVSPEKAIERS